MKNKSLRNLILGLLGCIVFGLLLSYSLDFNTQQYFKIITFLLLIFSASFILFEVTYKYNKENAAYVFMGSFVLKFILIALFVYQSKNKNHIEDIVFYIILCVEYILMLFVTASYTYKRLSQ